MSEEHKKKIGDANKGKPKPRACNTAEHNLAISQGLRGKPKSEEWKLKASIAAKNRWEKIRLSKQAETVTKEIENEYLYECTRYTSQSSDSSD